MSKTKKSLVLSCLSMLVCLTMLIGSTFAWFTDNASTGVNTIQAGTLDIDIIDADGNSLDGETLKWVDKDGNVMTDILWEPGCTYTLQPFKIINKGNLAAKVMFKLNGVDGDAKLLEALEFTVSYPGFDEDLRDVLTDGVYLLFDANGDTSETISISAHMKEEAGNEYQGKSVNGIGILIQATQRAKESDGFSNSYDSEAKFSQVLTATGTTSALSYSGSDVADALEGEIYTFLFDGEKGEKPIGVLVSNGAELALKNCTMTASAIRDLGDGYSSMLIVKNEGSTLTIDGGCYENDSDPASGVVANHVLRVLDNSECVIKGGIFLGSGRDDLIDVNSGATLTIEGGFFNARINPTLNSTTYDQNYSIYVARSKPGTVTVTGGTFVNCDPSQVWGVTVPDGYTVTSETQANGDIWYTVVAE